MNKTSNNSHLNNSDIINPVQIRTTHSLYSNFEDDLIFNKIGTPIMCCGKIVHINDNVYNVKVNDYVVFISTKNKEKIVLSANLVCQILDITNKNLISVIPYASYCMKILRIINPKIGQNIILSEISLFSIILKELLELSGVNVFIINHDQENNEYYRFLNEDKIFNGFDHFSEVFTKNKIKIDFFLYFAENQVNMNKMPKSVENKFNLSEISFYDVGLEDENYLKGVKYPINYVRWHYQNNLNYFISLVQEGFINLDFLEISNVWLNHIEELNDFISKISEEKRILVHFEK